MISKEAKSAYDRERYFNGAKQVRYKERKCALCGIFLGSRFGAYWTRLYCRACRDSGQSKRFSSRMYYLQNRKKIIEKSRVYKLNKKTCKA